MTDYFVNISQAGQAVLNGVTVSIQEFTDRAGLKSRSGEFLAPIEINVEPGSEYRMTLADGRYCNFTVLKTVIRSYAPTPVYIRLHSDWVNPQASESSP